MSPRSRRAGSRALPGTAVRARRGRRRAAQRRPKNAPVLRLDVTEARRQALLELALARCVPRLGVSPRDSRVGDDDREPAGQRARVRRRATRNPTAPRAPHGRAPKPPDRGSHSARRAPDVPPVVRRGRARARPTRRAQASGPRAPRPTTTAPRRSATSRSSTPRHRRTASPSSAVTALTDAVRSPASETIDTSSAGST